MVKIRLLGPPAIERDGAPAVPRGRKSWALLAYLLLAEHLAQPPPPGRAAVRRGRRPAGRAALDPGRATAGPGAPGLFTGDPVATGLGEDVTVDLHDLTAEPADPARLLDLGGELLDGLSVAGSPMFDSWLVVERHRLASMAEARLRQAALALLAAGQAAEAVPRGPGGGPQPLEEGNHELVRAARPRRRRSGGRPPPGGRLRGPLRRELKVEASPALQDAADAAAGSPRAARPAARRRHQPARGRAGRPSPPGPSRPGSTRCAAPAPTRPPTSTPRSRAGPWSRWGAPSSTPSAAATRRGAVVLLEAVRLASEAGDRETAVTAYRELGWPRSRPAAARRPDLAGAGRGGGRDRRRGGRRARRAR